jgi:hypothetical protein
MHFCFSFQHSLGIPRCFNGSLQHYGTLGSLAFSNELSQVGNLCLRWAVAASD